MTMTDPEEPAELEDVVVIGVRPVVGQPKIPTEHQQEIDPDADPAGSVWRPGEIAPENERQKECAAKEYEKKLNQEEPDRKKRKEFFSLIWVTGGQTATHTPRGGGGARITGPEIQEAMNDFGISGPDLLGLVHNHPPEEYCPSSGSVGFDEERANAYPSANDWNAIDFFVPVAFRAQVTLFILGCDNQMRAYPYADRANAERGRDQRSRPSEPIDPPDCQQ